MASTGTNYTSRDRAVYQAKSIVVDRLTIEKNCASITVVPPKGEEGTEPITCFHPRCSSPNHTTQPGRYRVCIQPRHTADPYTYIPLDPAVSYTLMKSNKNLHRKRGRGKDDEYLWMCLNCFEGLLNETWGFHQKHGFDAPDPETTMTGLSHRIVGEIRNHLVIEQKGSRKQMKYTGLFRLDHPYIFALNLWKAVHAPKSPSANGIDPWNWHHIPRANMVRGPNNTLFPTKAARDDFKRLRGKGLYVSIRDVKSRPLTGVLRQVDWMVEKYEAMLEEEFEGFSADAEEGDEEEARLERGGVGTSEWWERYRYMEYDDSGRYDDGRHADEVDSQDEMMTIDGLTSESEDSS